MDLKPTASSLSQNSADRVSTFFSRYSLTLLCCLCLAFARPQVANYISNGSFEDTYYCGFPDDVRICKFWSSIDSSQTLTQYFSFCSGIDNLPSNGFTTQYPRTGIAFMDATMYCGTVSCSPESSRAYMRNRLKKKLQAGETYCVKFYVNITDNSSHGIDKMGIYFGSTLLDTITKINAPLVFLSPQIQNPNGNIINDTVHWIPITGTFVANGDEKYALIGNFYSNTNTDTLRINHGVNYVGTDVCVDDVSCIPIDLPAFAGNDTTSVGSNSVYIGRTRDVGIDEDCRWYQLPIVITPTTPALDTAAGMWVCPPITSTYVVRQEICGNVKWDTVVVWKGIVGINNEKSISRQISFYPNPATDRLNITCADAKEGEIFGLTFVCSTGQLIRSSEPIFSNHKADIDVSNLAAGIYCITMQDKYGNKTSHRLIITK